MIRRLMILLLIVSYLFADVQLVNDYRVIIVKDGQKFSINDDRKKYKFESIDLDLGLINKTLDIKYIKKINLYVGNSSKEFATAMFLLGIVNGLESSRGNTPPIEVIKNISILSIPSSIIGLCIGYFFPKKKTYIISEDEWKFILWKNATGFIYN